MQTSMQRPLVQAPRCAPQRHSQAVPAAPQTQQQHCLRAQRQTVATAPITQTRSGRQLACRAEAAQADATPAAPITAAQADASALFQQLAEACEEVRRAPPSLKQEASKDVAVAMRALQAAGAVPKWDTLTSDNTLTRRNVFLGELKRVGITEPEQIGRPSVRNDAAFLFGVVGTTSVVAVAGGFLPGDWGFFVPYLTGGISLVVLAIGSTAPGLLQFFIDKAARVFPDYRERVLRHEAAHFLMGYLAGVPVTGYSLDIGKAHTDFAEALLQRRLIEGTLDDGQVDRLAIVAMAGATAEGMNYPEVQGQTADMGDLQRIMLRSAKKMPDAAQQNLTRWAVYQCAGLLRKYDREYAALQAAMQRGAPVAECVRAIEQAQ